MSAHRVATALGAVAVAVVIAACSGSGTEDITFDSRPAAQPVTDGGGTSAPTGVPETTGPVTGGASVGADLTVDVDVAAPTGPTIHADILGMTPAGLTIEQMVQGGVTVSSWGGNPITRYNYTLGNVFNHGADFEFRNTSYDNPPAALAQDAVLGNQAAGIKSRLAIPTLGWVAKDTNEDNCSFPDGDTGCLGKEQVGDCDEPLVAPSDPARTSIESTPETVREWLTEMAAAGAHPEFVAMDNEPDLWGHTHYDVHPACPTYEEILDKYLQYAAVVQDVLPDAALLGPALCCWYDYWNIAPGPEGDGEPDFLAWFLDGVSAHDEEVGTRSLDYLDVHFYPQSDVYNDVVDEGTRARRLRSTQALWNPAYRDESWIPEAITFLPRMREVIAAHYPGTKLFISEWNFGAENTMNGALAIADALGVFGREGLDGATYYRNPQPGSPGYLAFTLFGNYDGEGSWFGGTSVRATNSDAKGAARISSFAALGDDGLLRVMLVNRDPSTELTVALRVAGFDVAPSAGRWSLTESATSIVSDAVPTNAAVPLPASSITLLVLEPS